MFNLLKNPYWLHDAPTSLIFKNRMLFTQCIYVFCIWEQTATCAIYIINWLVFITELKSVYCAVRTGSLNEAVCASSLRVNATINGWEGYAWVDIAVITFVGSTHYGLDGPGCRSRWGQDFLHSARLVLGPTQPPVQWVTAVKWLGRDVDHPPPSRTEDKE